MKRNTLDFQIFAKPASYRCNLRCRYCYYLEKEKAFLSDSSPLMADDILERYISQHIDAHSGKSINFSWHGGEPTLLGIEYFQRIIKLQKKYCAPNKSITNGIQTNGTLLDDDWGRFLADNRFAVGLSVDGPQEIHDAYRCTRHGGGTHDSVMRGYEVLARHGVPVDFLCVVNDYNVMYPLQLYRFFTSIGANYLSFLPLVELQHLAGSQVSERSVHPEAFGAFLCTVFDEWVAGGIGAITIQIFEEAARTAFGQNHSLCLFRQTCGDIPVLEYNGEIFACDHYVDSSHRVGNIRHTPLAELLVSDALLTFGEAKKNMLSGKCRSCDVLAMCNGECPKNRFVEVAGQEERENYLCAGYQLFFRHCKPFVEAVSHQWLQAQERSNTKTGHGQE
jgi:uncharacterized protein